MSSLPPRNSRHDERPSPSQRIEVRPFVLDHHRHHGWVSGFLWLHGLAGEGSALVGIAVVGRPVARALQDGLTMEVTRLCTDGEPNGCSMLYGAARGGRQGISAGPDLHSRERDRRVAARGGLAVPLARPRPQMGHSIASADGQALDRGQSRLWLGRLARHRGFHRMIVNTLNPKCRRQPTPTSITVAVRDIHWQSAEAQCGSSKALWKVAGCQGEADGCLEGCRFPNAIPF